MNRNGKNNCDLLTKSFRIILHVVHVYQGNSFFFDIHDIINWQNDKSDLKGVIG
jgi:hypothetical protein